MDFVNKFGEEVHCDDYRYIAYTNDNKYLYLCYVSYTVYIVSEDQNGECETVYQSPVATMTPQLLGFMRN